MRTRAELKNYQHEQYFFRVRLVVAAILVLVCFGILIARLFFLQMVKYDHYQTMAENNRAVRMPKQTSTRIAAITRRTRK